MTIRNLDKYVANLWDWGFLDGCFSGTRIRVSDLDGIVERNGEFLVIEAKSAGAPIPKGQAIMFERMVRTGRHTVFVFWGQPSTPERMRVYSAKFPAGTEFETDLDGARRLVAAWFSRASGMKPQGGGNEHHD